MKRWVIRIPKALKPFYKNELADARTAFDKKHYQVSSRHLERADILCQPYPYEHTEVHWRMFCFGIKLKNFKELIGQIPVCNTGGANVTHYSQWNTEGPCHNY